jgi:tRNA(Ile)-lysidine synthase
MVGDGMSGLAGVFAASMGRLGPFGTAPRLAVAVSGGADSTALALLAQEWAGRHRGGILALIVDHGLRGESADEAALTAARLHARGIASRILTLSGLSGPSIQEKARAARYEALAEAAMEDGRLHLLLGHHAADQSETVTMRLARGTSGTEGIAAWTARHKILLLRPLLSVRPASLRAYLAAGGVGWVEDPSNENRTFERVRIRQAGTSSLPAGAEARRAREQEAAEFLARHATLRPEGFALIDAAAAPQAALGALIRVIGGGDYPPRARAAAMLAAKLRPATLGGVRILAAGRLGPGWLLVREAAACAPLVAARRGVMWDRRFVLDAAPPPGQNFGALRADARKFKKFNGLPDIVLRAMPCLRAVEGGEIIFPPAMRFVPPAPATSHPFLS